MSDSSTLKKFKAGAASANSAARSSAPTAAPGGAGSTSSFASGGPGARFADSPSADQQSLMFQGDRCVVRGNHKGVVMFVGDMGGSHGFMVGVLLDDPVGNSSGHFASSPTHKGKKFFDAPPKHGGFYPIEEVEFERRPVPTGAPKASKLRTARSKSASRKRTARSATTSRAGGAAAGDFSAAGGSVTALSSRRHPKSLVPPSPPDVSDGPIAAASASVAAGRGLHTAVVKQRAQFVITANDESGKQRQTGGDPFSVLVRGVLPPQNLRCKLHDHKNGMYTATYTAETTGEVEVAITLHGEHIEGSPFSVDCVTLRPDPANCVLRGNALTSAIARKPMNFEIDYVDALGQIAYAEELDVRIVSFEEEAAAEEAVGEGEEDPRLLVEGTLQVELKKASALTAIDLNGKSDPYVELSCAGEQAALSTLKQKTVNPVWNETFYFKGTLGGLIASGVDLKIFDSDKPEPRPGQDNLIGEVALSLEPLRHADSHEYAAEPVSTAGVVMEALAAKGMVADKDATKGTMTVGVVWLTQPIEVEENVFDLVVGEERVVVGPKPLILRDGVSLDSTRVDTSVKLAERAVVLIETIKETTDGVRVQIKVLTDSAGEALTAQQQVSGWVTAVKDGKSRFTRPHKKVHVNDRRLQLELWQKRLAADKAASASTAMSGKTGGRDRSHALEDKKDKVGPSFAHELADTTRGIGFAYGGVMPGTLHAHGHLLKTHQVHYSVGSAGRFLLHVGLRQQAATLPGSPFTLIVKPGPAHPPSCSLPTDALPLSSVVGTEGSLLVRVKDCMGNSCIEGGAPLRVSLNTDKVSATCEDQNDGTYLIKWKGESIGSFALNVLLQEHHISGSPAPLTMLPAPIDVSKCVVSGTGVKAAVAGVPAHLQIRCQDSFGNEANPLAGQKYGLCLFAISGASRVKTLDSEQESLPFEGSWERPFYSLSFVPTEAGDFDLHLWSDPEGTGVHEPLPGSPFALHVTAGEASASGSSVLDCNAQQAEGSAAGGHPVLGAGEKFSMRVQVRDAHGNNAFTSTDSELSATMTTPSGGNAALTVKNLGVASDAQVRDKKQSSGGSSSAAQVGTFEIVSTAELTSQGSHEVHVRLSNEDVAGSPLFFDVIPAAPIGSRSKLTLIGSATPIVNTPIELRLVLFDRYSNELRVGGVRVEAKIYGSKASECAVVDNDNGSFTLSFTAGVAGDYKAQVRVENNEMAPLTIKVHDKDGGAGGKDETAPSPAPAPAKL